MDRMRTSRVARANRVAMAAGDPAHAILTITDDGGVPLVTTKGPHGLSVGQFVTIAGASVAGYNGGPLEIVSAGSSTFDFSGVYTADSVGGTWAPA